MFNINLAITILILALPVSLLVQFMIKRKYSTDKIILGTTLLLMVIMFASLYVEGQVTGVDLVSQMDKNFESMLEVQKNALRDLEMSKSEIDKAGTIMRGTYNYIVTVMPMIIFIFSLIIAYLNYKISAFLINRTRDQSLKVPEFSLFTLPDNFIVGTVIMLLTSTIINRMEIPYALALRQNLMFIIGFLFLIQGFSLFDYFLKKIKIKKFFRVLILLINLILMPIGGILMILGFADSIFDLRKIRKKA